MEVKVNGLPTNLNPRDLDGFCLKLFKIMETLDVRLELSPEVVDELKKTAYGRTISEIFNGLIGQIIQNTCIVPAGKLNIVY